MKTPFRLAVALAALACWAGVATASTQIGFSEAGGSVFPARSYILTLPTPRGLSRSDVKITENGVRVSGLSVTRQGTVKRQSAVVLAIDASLTMKGEPIKDALGAARAFAARANPNEEIAVVTFNGSVHVLQPFTTSATTIGKALTRTPALVYGTKNYDALGTALGLLSAAHVASGSIIFLTDGQSVGNVSKPATVIKQLAAAHVRVFSVGLQSPAFRPAPLQQLASATDGSYVLATGPKQLRPILVELGRRLSNEYLVTYTSHSNPGTNVIVRASVRGYPAAASVEYATPQFHPVAAAPYSPSTADRVIQSEYTMIGVALAFALLLGYAIAHAAADRDDPLVDRVGDFVSVQRGGAQQQRTVAPTSTAIAKRGFLTRAKKVGKPRWTERLGEALDLAGIGVTAVQFALLTLVATVVVAFVLDVSVGPLGLLVALATPLLARALVKRRIAKKRRAFAEQLPDNLDVLASALRAGHSLVGALAVVADDAMEPSKSEFRRVLAEEQFGAQLEDAFKVVVDRMESPDLDQVALVSRLQREMGSNAAEVLDRVIETVRGRMEVRRLIRTLTAQGRLSRWILTALPIGLAIVMKLVSGSYMNPLFHRPLGQALIVLAILMVAAGSYLIGKIVDIPV